jgi:hypothetical protein
MGTRQAVRALRVVSVALVVAGVISAVAVGGTTKKAGAQQVATITAAPDNVAAAGTVVIKYHFKFAGNSRTVEFDGEEQNDFLNHNSVGHITPPGGLAKFNFVTDGNTMYVGLNRGSDATGEPAWWRIDIADGVLPDGSEGESAVGLPDGTNYLAYLRHLSTDVSDEGDTSIDGVAVHHYRAKLDLAKMLADQGLDSQQDQLQQLTEQGIQFETSMDVFIDDNGLPRRVSLNMSAEGFSFEIRLDFVDYGTPVDVVAPPEEQVARTQTIDSTEQLLAVGQEIGQLLATGG